MADTRSRALTIMSFVMRHFIVLIDAYNDCI